MEFFSKDELKQIYIKFFFKFNSYEIFLINLNLRIDEIEKYHRDVSIYFCFLNKIK